MNSITHALSISSNVWIVHSDYQLVWGWKLILNFNLVFLIDIHDVCVTIFSKEFSANINNLLREFPEYIVLKKKNSDRL